MTDQELKDLVASLAIDQAENKKLIKDLIASQNKTEKILLWMWVTQWEISEDIFWNNFQDIFEKEWKHIYRTIKNLVVKWKCEYDLIWVNWNEVFVWEVKTRLTNEHIDTFMEKRLKNFKKYMPEYKEYKLYWFVAWRSVPESTLKYARKNGLYVMKQDSKWLWKMINNEQIEAI